mgnify:FL=1
MIGTVISGYRIVRQVGKGGMGVVYKAVNEQIARTTAIKVLNPRYCQDAETVQRLMNEARAVNIVGHPGLISIHEFGQLEDGSGYLIMEFLDGDTLRARLKSHGGRWWPGGVRIAQQIASTLAATHEHGIVHRDLKPENVMLVADSHIAGGERAKILDFGVAAVRPRAGDGESAFFFPCGKGVERLRGALPAQSLLFSKRHPLRRQTL